MIEPSGPLGAQQRPMHRRKTARLSPSPTNRPMALRRREQARSAHLKQTSEFGKLSEIRVNEARRRQLNFRRAQQDQDGAVARQLKKLSNSDTCLILMLSFLEVATSNSDG